MPFLSFGEYLPDVAAYLSSGATEAKNVIPNSDGTYGPFKGLTAYSSALDARAQGAVATRDNSGNVNIFAGNASKLYRLITGTTTFANVSIAAGYTTSDIERWTFAQDGNRIVATNFTQAMQSFIMGTSTLFAVLAAAAPRARYLAMSRNFLLAANTNDAIDLDRPQRVWWPAIKDPTNWPALGSSAAAAVQSDARDLTGDGGNITGIVGGLGTADVGVFQERAVFRGAYVGSPLVFDFDLVEGAKGTTAPGSIVQVGAVVYYLGEDGFAVFDGSNSKMIGAGKVDKTFFADADAGQLNRMSSAADVVNNLIVWAYAGSGHVAGLPNRLLMFNFHTGRFARAEIDVQLLLRALTFGVTLDELINLVPTLDDLLASFDLALSAGGRPQFAGFDTAHKLAHFTGAALAAILETGEMSGDGQRLLVQGIRPLVDGGTVTAAIGHRGTPDGVPTFTTATSPGADGNCPQRTDARYARARVSIAASGVWAKAQGIEPVLRKTGKR